MKSTGAGEIFARQSVSLSAKGAPARHQRSPKSQWRKLITAWRGEKTSRDKPNSGRDGIYAKWKPIWLIPSALSTSCSSQPSQSTWSGWSEGQIQFGAEEWSSYWAELHYTAGDLGEKVVRRFVMNLSYTDEHPETICQHPYLKGLCSPATAIQFRKRSWGPPLPQPSRSMANIGQQQKSS